MFELGFLALRRLARGGFCPSRWPDSAGFFLVVTSTGCFEFSPSDGVALSPSDGVALSPFGVVALSPFGGVVFSPFGVVALSPFGGVVFSPFGGDSAHPRAQFFFSSTGLEQAELSTVEIIENAGQMAYSG